MSCHCSSSRFSRTTNLTKQVSNVVQESLSTVIEKVDITILKVVGIAEGGSSISHMRLTLIDTTTILDLAHVSRNQGLVVVTLGQHITILSNTSLLDGVNDISHCNLLTDRSGITNHRLNRITNVRVTEVGNL